MTEQKRVTFIRLDDDSHHYYYMSGASTDDADAILIGEGFTTDAKMIENVRVTILDVEQGPNESKELRRMVETTADGTSHYYLPGASLAKVKETVEKAGFKFAEKILDVVYGPPETENDS